VTRDRKILEEAAKLFFQRGFEAVGVDEIGERAGVTGPAIYRHFSGKDEILATLFDEALDRVINRTTGTFDDPFAELEHRVRAHAMYMIEEPQLASIWIREHRSLSGPYLRRHHRRELRYVDGWSDCLQRCFPDLTSDQVTTATWMALGTLNSMAQWPPAVLSAESLADALTAYVLDGLNGVCRTLQKTRVG
jgi:AcrR family transcriptional regulator